MHFTFEISKKKDLLKMPSVGFSENWDYPSEDYILTYSKEKV